MTNSNSPYKAVVIGCGFIGSRFNEKPSYDPLHTHAAGYQAHESTNLVAMCDKDETRVNEAAQYWQSKPYTNAKEMLEKENPDIISIASPTSTHAGLLDIAINTSSVKAIFCEKPVTEDLEQSIGLIDKAREKGIIFAVNYIRRFNDGHNKIKALLDSDTLGDIRIIRGIYQKGILNNGSHLIDLFRMLFGKISIVYAESAPQANYSSHLSGMVEFENGLSAHIQGAASVDDTFFEIDIIGTKGRIRTEQNGHYIWHYDLMDSPLFPGIKSFVEGENISKGLIECTYNGIQELVECIEGNRESPSCTGDDAVQDLAVVDAMVKSANTGNRIEVVLYDQFGP